MPWWASLYVAFIIISLPFGLMTIRRIEKDILHPLGGLLSTLLSASFIVSYYYPDLLPYHGAQTWLYWGFVVGWDCYSYLRLNNRLPELLEQTDDSPGRRNNVFLIGLIITLPVYIWGFLVCLRAMA
ncbi:MAG: hypothetical protein COA99_08120 [Moraxellaceae bacterium]|nr:MAG: hypothetical protein COA99_08120 [Moraxellaceae bacterium]